MLPRDFLCIFLLCGCLAYAQNGAIGGKLLDSNGNPVAHADVFAMFFLHCDIRNETAKLKIESGPAEGCLNKVDGRVDAITDEVGDFYLRDLKWGVYELGAQKPEDGYRSTFRNLFYARASRAGVPIAFFAIHQPHPEFPTEVRIADWDCEKREDW